MIQTPRLVRRPASTATRFDVPSGVQRASFATGVAVFRGALRATVCRITKAQRYRSCFGLLRTKLVRFSRDGVFELACSAGPAATDAGNASATSAAAGMNRNLPPMKRGHHNR